MTLLVPPRPTSPASLAALVAARGLGDLRRGLSLASVCLALQCAGCEEVPSALRSGQGTEIPQSHALRRRAKLLVLTRPADDAAVSDAAADSGERAEVPDAEVTDPLSMDVSRSCPVQISLQTVSYGSGDEAQDDYAPNNVGAIWISRRDGDHDVFVRTVAAWGPMYFDQALTWIDQTRGNLVDTVTLPTRPGHMRAVEASWDCRDTKQQLVAAGVYRVSFEFTEVEAQGPVLTGERALALTLGSEPTEAARAPQGYFGEIRVKAGRP